jgi:hypothetical protein
MAQELKDANGRLIGRIEVTGGGDQELYDSSGWLKGVYRPNYDQTFDSSGHLVGTGNLLTMLL